MNIYLSDEDYQGLVNYIPIPEHDLRKVSKASANHAVREVIKELEDAMENTFYSDHRQGRVEEIIEDLKKLVEEL